jgi:hypothetical protein
MTTATSTIPLVDTVTADELNDLRRAWHTDAKKNGGRTVFDRGAPQSFAAMDPRVMPWIKSIGDYFFEPTRVAFATSAANRERCIISIAAATDPNGPLLLPLHVFWGLMEGLEPHDIADTIAVAGLYTGLQHYADAMRSFLTVLGWIKASIASGFQPPADSPHPTTEDRVRGTIAMIKRA